MKYLFLGYLEFNFISFYESGLANNKFEAVHHVIFGIYLNALKTHRNF